MGYEHLWSILKNKHMKSIDFKKFRMYKDIQQKEMVVIDVSINVSDLIYKNTNGVMGHDIALRIYRSKGPVSFNDEELQFLREFAKETTPIFQDSFEQNIVDSNEETS